jgi:hypothetical protein
VIEVVGYVASSLVVLSLTMTSVVRLRWISLIGSLAFVAYGALIESIPIIITNLAIAIINLWFLRKELGGHRDLGAVVVPIDSPFLIDFVHFHLADIRRFQPTFDMPTGDDAMCVLLTRDGLPAGAVIGHRRGDELEIELDYVLRAYRDSRLGTWLFGAGSGVFRAQGITRLVSGPGTDLHPGYLQRMGFQRVGDRLVLDIG